MHRYYRVGIVTAGMAIVLTSALVFAQNTKPTGGLPASQPAPSTRPDLVRESARSVVFVLDVSETMQPMMESAKSDLAKQIDGLRADDQSFALLFAGEPTRADVIVPRLQPVDFASRIAAKKSIEAASAAGPQKLLDAMRAAVAARPRQVFVYSDFRGLDANFLSATTRTMRGDQNTRINLVYVRPTATGAADGAASARRVAEENGGTCRILDAAPANPTTTPAVAPSGTVFVVDATGSMLGLRFEAAKQFVVHEIERLRDGHPFNVIVFQGAALGAEGVRPLANRLVPASAKSRTAAMQFVREGTILGNGTDPTGALALAFGLHPERVVFLSDGRLEIDMRPEDIPRSIWLSNVGGQARVDAVLIQNDDEKAVERFRAIARDGDGQFIRIGDSYQP